MHRWDEEWAAAQRALKRRGRRGRLVACVVVRPMLVSWSCDPEGPDPKLGLYEAISNNPTLWVAELPDSGAFFRMGCLW